MKNEVLENAPIATKPSEQSMLAPTAQREISEVQGMMTVAKRFPRNEQEAIDRIMLACQRPGLAETAIYSYVKGGTEITGPSIRLAEAIAQAWGNIAFGVRELEQKSGESIIESFALDMETNVRQVKVFTVKHIRHTKQGSYSLDDPREIYEMTANQGARRLRSCILGIIPGDIVEAAVDECEKTMKAKADTGPEATKKLLEAFAGLSVTKDQIEKRIQRRIDAITAAQIVSLRKIYNSLKDGMSTPPDWFEVENGQTEQPKTGVEAAKEALKKAEIEKEVLVTEETPPPSPEPTQPDQPELPKSTYDMEDEITPEKCHILQQEYEQEMTVLTTIQSLSKWWNTKEALIEIKRVAPETYTAIKLSFDKKVTELKKKKGDI